MTITYPLALPNSQAPASVRMMGRSVVGRAVSPFTLAGQVYAHPGQQWQADIVLPRMRMEVAEGWAAWLLALNGREGTFLMGDPARRTARGALGGSPVVDGGSQTGQVLAIRGASAGVSGWLLAGDYIQLGTGSSSRLHKVLADVATDGSGQAQIDIWPRLRASPADGATVVTAGCVGVWELVSNEMAWDVGLALVYGLSFSAQEALR